MPTERWPSKIEDAAIESSLIDKLIKARRARGMTPSDLARRLGVSPACISNWEAGVHVPNTFSKWREWARVVGLRFDISLR